MTPRTALDVSLAARQRVATGRAFEADVDITARRWEFEKIGKIWRHTPSFVKVKKAWVPQRGGGGHVDRTGHVCCADAGEVLDSATGNRRLWRGCSPAAATKPAPFTIPVAFDCKVLASDAVTYHHDPRRLHQLVSLKDAAGAGVYAFLLVYAPKNNAVFALPIEKWYGQLLGEGVTLIRQGVPTMSHMAKETIGCDFIRLLPLCVPNCLR